MKIHYFISGFVDKHDDGDTPRKLQEFSPNEKDVSEKTCLPATLTEDRVENDQTQRTRGGAEKTRRKVKKNKERKQKYKCEFKKKLQPPKLKVRKVTSQNDDGYSLQYNISNSNEKSELDTFTIHKTEECKGSDDNLSSDVNVRGSVNVELREGKRKSSLDGKYARYSDDSDFESDSISSEVNPKVSVKKEKDVCGCGSGSQVKYFTDICKRQRCPCYSKGKSCATCKCRFCSNQFPATKDVTDVSMFTESESEDEQPQLTYWLKEENDVVDVETM